jgi:hypothetical protein
MLMKKNKRDVSEDAAQTQEPLVVCSRKNSKRPLKAPFKDQATAAQARKLKAAERQCAGTTPWGRAIVTKITTQARRKLFEFPPASGAAQLSATPQPPESASSSAQATAAKVGAPPPPAPAATLAQPAAKVTQPSTPAGPAKTPVSPAPTAPMPPAPASFIEAPAGGHDSATLIQPLPQPYCPVAGCSMAEARRLGLVGPRNK